MVNPKLFRKRFIPNEIIPLKDDIILQADDYVILTKWVPLRPREDMTRGISAYYLTEGFKISKIFDKDDEVLYWYCDIIQIKKDHNKNTVIIEDLLIDILLYNDGTMRIMDLDELADALEQQLISQEEAVYAIRTLHHLLHIITMNQFHTLQTLVNQVE